MFSNSSLFFVFAAFFLVSSGLQAVTVGDSVGGHTTSDFLRMVRNSNLSSGEYLFSARGGNNAYSFRESAWGTVDDGALGMVRNNNIVNGSDRTRDFGVQFIMRFSHPGGPIEVDFLAGKTRTENAYPSSASLNQTWVTVRDQDLDRIQGSYNVSYRTESGVHLQRLVTNNHPAGDYYLGIYAYGNDNWYDSSSLRARVAVDVDALSGGVPVAPQIDLDLN